MKLSFHKRLFFSLSILMAALMIFCIGAFSLFTYRNLYKESMNNLNHLCDRTGYEFQTLLDNMDELALYASTNPEIRNAFTQAKEEDYSDSQLSQRTAQILASISIPNTSSHFRISLYNKNGNFTSIGIPYNKQSTMEKLNSSDYKSWYENLPVQKNRASFSGFHKDYWNPKGDTYLSLYREIFDAKSAFHAVGIIEIQCPSDFVKKLLNFDNTDYSCYLFQENGNLIFSTEKTDFETANSVFQSCTASSTGHTQSAEHIFYSSTKTKNNFYVVLTQSEKHIWKIILPQIATVFLMGIGSFFITISAIFIVTKRATRPLSELTDSVKQISLSTPSLQLDASDYPDEISSLNQAFDKMLLRLRQSMDENIRRQSYEMKANMIALQAQMDPHFLYNTLTVIKSLSREKNTAQITRTCDYLVKMLRYISSYDDHTVSLNQELAHTENYLELMKIRFEDQFTYTFSIDSDVDTENLRIPKLTLQPLVENCFQHGFKTVVPPWNVYVHFWQEENHWFVNVTDNGTGITPDKKEELMNKIEEFLSHPSDSISSMKIGGMGLVNTVARLKLRYKSQILFDITALPNGGTSVTLGGIKENEYICN